MTHPKHTSGDIIKFPFLYFKPRAKNNALADWEAGYRISKWFGFIYRFLHGEEKPRPDTVRKAFKYRIDTTTGILWILRRDDAYLSCIPETHLLRILQSSHDYGGHWGKEGTLAK